MSKTNLFGLLVLGASAIGLVGTTKKLMEKNKELEYLTTDYDNLEDWKNEAIAERDKAEEELQEMTAGVNELLNMLEESNERYNKLQDNFNKMCSAVDYWQNKYKQQKQENEELKLK